MGWYNTRIDPTTAKLALEGAGAGAKALAALAKIPLSIDNLNYRDRELSQKDTEIRNRMIQAQIRAGATIEAATKKADAAMTVAALRRDGTHDTALSRIAVADRGVEGKRITAEAKNRATRTSRLNNKQSNLTNLTTTKIKARTDLAKAKTQKEIAEIHKRAKAPVEVTEYDESGKRIKSKVTKAWEDTHPKYTPKELEELGKKMKQEAEQKKKKKKKGWWPW